LTKKIKNLSNSALKKILNGSKATNFGSKRTQLKFITSLCVAEELLRDMFGKEDKMGFSMSSRKVQINSRESNSIRNKKTKS